MVGQSSFVGGFSFGLWESPCGACWQEDGRAWPALSVRILASGMGLGWLLGGEALRLERVGGDCAEVRESGGTACLEASGGATYWPPEIGLSNP